MITKLRAHWPKISAALLATTLLGAGGVKLYDALTGDCCRPGASCCYPGSPCGHHAKVSQRDPDQAPGAAAQR